MLDLTKLNYKNNELKIEVMTSKEQIKELVKTSKHVRKNAKKNMQKDLEKNLNQAPRVLLIKDKKNNELLGEIAVTQTTVDGTVIGIMPELYVHKTTKNQYAEVIQFLSSSVEILGGKKIVIMAMHDEHADALLELGFCKLYQNDLQEYFGIEMLRVCFNEFNIKGFFTQDWNKNDCSNSLIPFLIPKTK